MLVGLLLYVQYSRALGVPASLHRPPLPAQYPVWVPPPLDAGLLATIAAQPGPLLELPASTAPGPNATAMYHSTLHWRPILNGYSSYWPAGFVERMALAAKLPEPTALAALRRETGVTGILVHLAQMTPEDRRTWTDLLAGGGNAVLRPLAIAADDALLEVRGTGAPCAARAAASWVDALRPTI
jgi:hypothetical protein